GGPWPADRARRRAGLADSGTGLNPADRDRPDAGAAQQLLGAQAVHPRPAPPPQGGVPHPPPAAARARGLSRGLAAGAAHGAAGPAAQAMARGPPSSHADDEEAQGAPLTGLRPPP